MISHNFFFKKSPPCSSTKPTSWSEVPHPSLAQAKCGGHQVLPSAVMKGPLCGENKYIYGSFRQSFVWETYNIIVGSLLAQVNAVANVAALFFRVLAVAAAVAVNWDFSRNVYERRQRINRWLKSDVTVEDLTKQSEFYQITVARWQTMEEEYYLLTLVLVRDPATIRPRQEN